MFDGGTFPPVRSGVNLDSTQIVSSVIVFGSTPVGPFTFTRTNNSLLSVSGNLQIGTSGATAFTTTFNGFAANFGTSMASYGQSTVAVTNGSQLFATENLQTQQSSVLNITGSTVTARSFDTYDQSSINVSSGGTLTLTGTGVGSVVHDTTKVTIGSSSTLDASQNVSVVGGELAFESGSFFSLASGRTLSASGGTSKLTFNRSFAVNAGTTLSASAGGDIVGNNYIDVGNGATGTLVLDGVGTTLTSGANISDWGFGPAGLFSGTLSNSASATVSSLRVGTNNAAASLSVTGGASLSISGTFAMGGGASVRGVTLAINGGSFNTGSGGAIFDNRATVFLQSGALTFNSDANLNAGSTLNWTGGNLSYAGRSLNVSGGVFARNAVGSEIPNGGTLRVTNGGASTGTSYLDVANGNVTGTLVVDGVGSLVTAASLSDWGLGTGHTASVSLSNSGQANMNSLQIGTSNAAASVTVASSATLSTASTLFVGGGTTARTVAVNVAGGTLTAAGLATLANQAILTLSSGTANLNNGGVVQAGGTISRTGGTLNVASGKTLDIAGGTFNRNAVDYEVSNGSTLRVLGGGQSTGTSYLDVANTNASGSLVVEGSGTLLTAGELSDWGYGAGRTANVAIANSAQVNLTSTINSLRIGTNNAASTVAVSGLATLKLNGSLGVGGGAALRTVNLNVSGGTVTADGPATFDNRAVVNLGLAATAGSINFNGGATLNAGSEMNWASGFLNVASGQTFAVNGGTLTQTVGGTAQSLNTTLNVINGGTFTSANYFDVRTGTLNVANPGSTLTVNGGADTFWTYSGGDVANVNITDGGVATYNSGLSVGNGGGVANVTINTGGRLNTLRLLANSGFAKINVNNPSTLTPAVSVSGLSDLGTATILTLSSGRVNLGQLTMRDSARIIPAAATNTGVIAATSLSMANLSKIDLASGRLELNGTGTTVSANLRALIGGGYNGGDWQGLRVTSSAAAASGGTAGLYYGPSVGLTVAKLALYGDADGDGGVSINDFNALAANFGVGVGRFWTDGDFDYDGGVSINDFNRLAANFGKTLGVPSPGPNYAALALWDFAVAHHAEAAFIEATGVPEPTGLTLLAAGGLIGLRRRSRR